MTERTVARATDQSAVGVRYRPMYARALGLRHLRPGGMLCFVYFEGSIALSLLLALAELVTWWVVLLLPLSVAVMVKVNDLVAGAVARSVARTPERERERVRREVSAFMPVVGRAAVVTPPAGAGAAVVAPIRRASAAVVTTPREATAEGAAAVTPPAAEGAAAVTPPRETTGAVVAPLGEATGESAAWPPAGALTFADGAVETGGHGDATSAGQPADLTAGDECGQQVDAAAAVRREMAGQHAAAGRYLDAAWRQHAYAMAHQADHADQATRRERQSASRRYE